MKKFLLPCVLGLAALNAQAFELEYEVYTAPAPSDKQYNGGYTVAVLDVADVNGTTSLDAASAYVAETLDAILAAHVSTDTEEKFVSWYDQYCLEGYAECNDSETKTKFVVLVYGEGDAREYRVAKGKASNSSWDDEEESSWILKLDDESYSSEFTDWKKLSAAGNEEEDEPEARNIHAYIYVAPNPNDASHDVNAYTFTAFDQADINSPATFAEAVEYIGQNVDAILESHPIDEKDREWIGDYDQFGFEFWEAFTQTTSLGYAVIVYGQEGNREYYVISLPDYAEKTSPNFDDQSYKCEYSGWLAVPTTTAIKEVKHNAAAAAKSFQNGSLIISDGSHLYNAMGVEIK